tara:strand:+ start:211 stop:573 length:363 start_codon:yes stop_codon:yes gene_type:complete
MQSETFLLDQQKDDLYGWHCICANSEEVIDSILAGIRLGDDIPPVRVSKRSDGAYQLNGDGHHRAIAYYRIQRPMKSKLSPGLPLEFPLDRTAHISELNVRSIPGILAAKRRSGGFYRKL